MQQDQSREKQKAIQEAAKQLALQPPSVFGPEDEAADNWTIKEKLQKRLFYLGMSEKECVEVVERVKALPSMEPMKNRWHERAETWAVTLFGSLWRQTTAEALKWMDENNPIHNVRALLTEEPTPSPAQGIARGIGGKSTLHPSG
jgi:hypothetical protein